MTQRIFTIRGISGWDYAIQKETEEQKKENEFLKKAVFHLMEPMDKPHNSSECDLCKKTTEVYLEMAKPEGPKEDLSTPEKRLEALKKAMAEGKVEMAPDDRGGFVIQWEAANYGFGELTVWMKEDGAIEIDDEASNRTTLEQILMAVLNSGTTISEKMEKERVH